MRSLCTVVETGDRSIVIDPGLSLGSLRFGLKPHPFQVAIGAQIRRGIIAELRTSTDIVISHFDGDHTPTVEPNQYQIAVKDVVDDFRRCRLWIKGPQRSSDQQLRRWMDLEDAIDREIPGMDGKSDGPFSFSRPVPHGQQDPYGRSVMMTRIVEGRFSFVHASDTQLLDTTAIEAIVAWQPDVVLVSGPPLYRFDAGVADPAWQKAADNAVAISRVAGTTIVDHHLLRSEMGLAWIEDVRRRSVGRVICAADFMNRGPLLLEAWRGQLYEMVPVPDEWHSVNAQGVAPAEEYLDRTWAALRASGLIAEVGEN